MSLGWEALRVTIGLRPATSASHYPMVTSGTCMNSDSRALRNALGRFATGVCLVTTVADDGTPMALTINSFASVSLHPSLILWSLQNDSEAYPVYAKAKRFAICVLAEQQAALSVQYATKRGHAMAVDHYVIGAQGAPVVHNALATFECELEVTHAGGDHLIIVGRVLAFAAAEGAPLIFYGGSYRELA
jgi:flavin reductase (DIM6/NTAB) family NADH-FMN oxidoreductase RutF